MKTLYFDCFAGASGNMILGGLVSLGIHPDSLAKELGKLDLPDFRIEFSSVNRAGINSVHAETIYKEEKAHRHLSDIERVIDSSELLTSVKTRAVKIFSKLAEAEAKVHGIEAEKVHFHEVGAMDAIIDVVGACVGFEMLGIDKFICSKIHVGSGFVEIAHGKYPVPPPAVAELLRSAPIYSTEIEGELITPTGAAIIASVCDEYGTIPEMEVEEVGYGAGSREYERFPNVLRLMLGSTSSSVQKSEQRTKTDHLLLIETNLDDVSPEILGFVMEKALEIGALDCWFTPIQMKKNRPATKISVLCEREKKQILSEMLFFETTTLGVRISEIERNCLPRELTKVETEFGEIVLKVARYGKKIVNIKPEHDVLKKIALETGRPLKEIELNILGKFKKDTGET